MRAIRPTGTARCHARSAAPERRRAEKRQDARGQSVQTRVVPKVGRAVTIVHLVSFQSRDNRPAVCGTMTRNPPVPHPVRHRLKCANLRGSVPYYVLNSSNCTMRCSLPAVNTASQRAIVPRLSRPEMSGSAPASRPRRAAPPWCRRRRRETRTRATAGDAMLRHRRGSCNQSCWAHVAASPASRWCPGQVRRFPQIATECRYRPPAPSRAGPVHTSSQLDARAPEAYSRM